MINITGAQGNDPNLGSWNETKLTCNLVHDQLSTLIIAHIRQWIAIRAFTFHLKMGNKVLTNRLSLDMEQVHSVFPSFHIEKIDINDQRGYFTFGG